MAADDMVLYFPSLELNSFITARLQYVLLSDLFTFLTYSCILPAGL
jgi:hypothetical protein